MSKNKYIYLKVMVLIAGAIFITSQQLFAQKEGVVKPQENVMNHGYQYPQRWSGSKFAKPSTFADRSYISVGMSAEYLWEMPSALGNEAVGFSGDVTFGHWLAPVHGLELQLGYGSTPYTDFNYDPASPMQYNKKYNQHFALGLNYLFNLTSYAFKSDQPRKWELMSVVGAQFRTHQKFTLGANMGMRVKYNINSKFGFYVEPNVSMFDDRLYGSNKFKISVLPTVSAGFSIAMNPIISGYGRMRERMDFDRHKDDYPNELAIKTNLLYDAMRSINLAIEYRVGRKTTMEMSGAYNPWALSDSTSEKTEHILLQQEFKFWVKERFVGHFFGAYTQASYFNLGGDNWITSAVGGMSGVDKMNASRYDGWLVGAGFSYGYLWRIAKRWGLEATIGGGYAYVDYGKYDYGSTTTAGQKGTKHYFGATKAGLSLIFMIQ